METQLGNTRVIKVKFLGPTNYSGDRIKITEDRFGKKESVIIPYSYAYNDAKDQAIEYLQKERNINILGFGYFAGEYYLFSDSWQYDESEFKTIK